jgi:UDP-N-acetylglucosamine 2-epimerase
MHRSENVDDPKNLKQVLVALSDSKLNYLFPMHPHTLKRIQDFGLTKYLTKRIIVIEPLDYLSFLMVFRNCKFVTSPRLNKRALILRDCTERPESVDSGHCVLCTIQHDQIMELIEIFDNFDFRGTTSPNSPYGNGTAAIKICEILERRFPG